MLTVLLIFSRKAKLLAELEISSSPDDQILEEDLEAQMEDRMRKMIAFRQKMFTDAETNIKDAQARYKDYDKKRSHCEVYV